MKKRLCILLLLSIFLCSILAACGGSGGSGSGPSGSAGASPKNQISVQFDNMSPVHYTEGSGDRIYTSNGYVWDIQHYYSLCIDLTIKNTGNVVSRLDNSIFSAYWDDSKLQLKSAVDFNGTNYASITLAPSEQTTAHIIYTLTESQYNSWNTPGHDVRLIIQYADGALMYTYSTGSRTFDVN